MTNLKKSSLIFTLSFMLVCVSSSQAFAKFYKSRKYYIGKIVSINEANKEITLKDYNSKGKEIILSVENGWSNAIENQEVVISVLKGTTIAKSIRKIKK